MRTSKPITVTLGPLQKNVDAWVASGEYGSTSEVLRDAVRALAQQKAALDEILRHKVQAALADARPSVPADEVFSALKTLHQRRLAESGGK